MRYNNFWCISFVVSESFKHFEKTPKSWEKFFFSITIFHQKPEKTLLQARKPLRIDFFFPTPFSNNHWQKSWDTCMSGRFPIHTGPTPPLSLQTMLDACIQNCFRVSTLHRLGGGRTARKFRKRMYYLMRESRMTEKYEYCTTVPNIFVHDCSLCRAISFIT